MRASNATIRVTNLRLRTFVGFNPDEIDKQQDVIINAEIQHLLDPSVLDDDVGGALNYKVITKAIIRHVEQGRFLLLEKLAHDLLEICSRDAAVTRASVTVDKPHALRFADSVSITLDYDPNQATSENRDEYYEHYPRPLSQAS